MQQHRSRRARQTQGQLQAQLAALEQMLSKMQDTISAQNSEIASLTAKVAERAANSATHTSRAEEQDSASDDSDADAPATTVRPALYYWIAGLAIAAVLSLALSRILRRTDPDAAPGPVAKSPGVEPTEVSRAPAQAPTESKQPAAADSKPAGATTDSRQPDKDPNQWRSPHGFESWRERNRAAHNQALARTEELPRVAFDQLDAKTIETQAHEVDFEATVAGLDATMADLAAAVANESDPGASTTTQAHAIAAQDGRTLANKEIARILEGSAGREPDRVDIQIKLLEIYHHEVLGNRADFQAVLSKLLADSVALSPTQRALVEKLQRTLLDGKPEPGSEFVTKVAM